MKLRLILTACLLGWIALASAQPAKPADYGIKSKKALALYQEGQRLAAVRDRSGAVSLYKAAIDLEPEFAHAHFEWGVNAWVIQKYEEAAEHLRKAYELNGAAFRGIEYYLGESLFLTGDYAGAAPVLEAFVSGGIGRQEEQQRAARDLRHARFAAEAVQRPVDFSPRNLGGAVNTQRHEYLPQLTADNQMLLFTSPRPESVGGYIPSMRDYSEDFYYAVWQDTGWSEARNLGGPINTPDNEGAGSLTQDGRMLFFAACERSDGLGSCDLYVSERSGDRWSAPRNLGPAVNSRSWESQPCLSADGRTLYFCSARPGGLGGHDIWHSRLVDGEWTEAQPLPAPVNSPGNEYSPFIHADGHTLYFSSDYHPGFGRRDLFLSRRDEAGAWSEPQNLGYPLNTVSDEGNIFLAASGRKALINSDRPGGLGLTDLYEFETDPGIRPDPATFLRGLVRDSISRRPLEAVIQLVDVERGDTIRQLPSDAVTGRFLMSLPLERNYAAFVSAPGYFFASKRFSLKGAGQETFFDLTIDLQPIRKGIQVVLNNLFFESGRFELQETSRPELETLLGFLQDNPRLRIEIQGHTDNVGSEQDNQLLSARRAEAVRSWLVERGIEAARITAAGYGESRPVADNETEAGRAQNRRTEFKVLAN
ncbi:MAG: OmpA family protein [Bacteroidia bacterium]|nr:OmpA family protein [Bacteroidia bacterium]